MIDEKLLLELATAEDVPEGEDIHPEVLRFIFDLDIKPVKGQQVRTDIIYFHYIKWKARQKKDAIPPLSRKGFFKEFKKMFNRISNSGHRAYNVTKNSFDLSDKFKREMKRFFKEEKEWRENQKQKETERKTQD